MKTSFADRKTARNVVGTSRDLRGIFDKSTNNF